LYLHFQVLLRQLFEKFSPVLIKSEYVFEHLVYYSVESQ
ncbi:unnamed protein product, partial [Heterotrigona itama]